MSWHTSALFIAEREPTDFASLLSDLGFPDGIPSGTVDFEDATSSMANGKSVAHINGWTVICDPNVLRLPQRSGGRRYSNANRPLVHLA